MFKDFGRRLERDVRRSVDGRLKVTEQLSLFIFSVYTDDFLKTLFTKCRV